MQTLVPSRWLVAAVCLLSLFCLGAAAQEVQPVGYWSFDSERPWINQCVPDSAVNNEAVALTEGMAGKAALFQEDGSLVCPDASGRFNFLDGTFTIEALIKPTDVTGNQRLVCYYDHTRGNAYRHYELTLHDGKLTYRIGDMAANTSEHTVFPGHWAHVALVADGSHVTFYINGGASGSYPQPAMPQGGPLDLNLGCYTPGHQGFRGVLDELRIYDSAVTAFRMPARKLKGQRVLFLDDHHVAAEANVRRVVHQPTKHPDNPVVRREQPWEKLLVGAPKVLYDDDAELFRMWYRACYYIDPDIYSDLRNRNVECYAESKDGIRWHKPNLGLVEFEGSKDNNCLIGGGGIVRIQHLDNPVTKLARFRSRQRFIEFSDDGFHWKGLNTYPIIKGKPYLTSISYDAVQKRYYAYGQDGFPRHVWGKVSEDLLHWSDAFMVLKAGPGDPEGLEFYTMVAYPDDDLLIGLLWTYHSRYGPGNEPPRPRQYGTIDVELAVSRDGFNWRRVAPNETFLPCGPENAWDWGMAMPLQPVVRDDTIYFYYEGWDGDHGTKDRTAAIGLATLGRDRYLSLTPSDAAGPAEVSTVVMRVDNGKLWVNADATDGQIRVAVCDAQGEAVPGYAASHCRPVTGDAARHQVTWQETDKLPQGEFVLKFTLAGDVHLYAFGSI